MLNDVPNRNDATGVANNVCLTIMGTKQLSMATVYLVIIQKNRLIRDERDNDMKTTKVHADGNKHCPGKERRLYTQ